MQWELTERLVVSLPKVSKACEELVEGIRGLLGIRRKIVEGIRSLLGVRRKLAKGIRSLLGVRSELAEGNRELDRIVSGVRRKKTKRLVRRSSGVAEKFVGSEEGLVGLDDHMIVID
ncbi:hypothetical protein B296_00047858 [Ensete ventricosum]|uniref:Uncharacterized protein n=1 Tax=Ensete ventricosum TaxID=4639 RepID=A0A426X4I8_ENSVE|nr:hypothetical protein B296_00047858 [Ensete ventricosum]